MNRLDELLFSNYQAKIRKMEAGEGLQHTYVELLCILEGTAECLIEERKLKLQSGQLLLIFPYQIYEMQEMSAEFEVLSLCFTIDFEPDFEKNFCDYTLEEPLYEQEELLDVTKTAIYWLKRDTCTARAEADVVFLERERGWLTVVLGDLFARRALCKRTDGSLTPELYRELVHYLEKNHADDFSLAEAAACLGVSQYFLSHLLTKQLHLSLHKLAQLIRLNHAKKLLLTTNGSVMDIALECGFRSEQTFARNFKKVEGMPPAAYRKLTDGAK